MGWNGCWIEYYRLKLFTYKMVSGIKERLSNMFTVLTAFSSLSLLVFISRLGSLVEG
jgi:hypothetical protein